MNVELKVCGITELEDARYLAGAGADYLGFVQHEESPRYAPPPLANDIIEWVHGPKPVGVFVNTPAPEVNAAADEAGFELVQLHGQEPPELVKAVNPPVIKTIHIRRDSTPDQLRALFDRYDEVADYFLLDTHDPSIWGGTGESFDWQLPRDVASDVPFFLAGGIDVANVGRAIDTVRPFAVDLSSSLESAPGAKSFEKIDAFLNAFQQAQEEGSPQSA